jgi:hypothetical protein
LSSKGSSLERKTKLGMSQASKNDPFSEPFFEKRSKRRESLQKPKTKIFPASAISAIRERSVSNASL